MDQHEADIDNSIERADDNRLRNDGEGSDDGLRAAIESYVGKRFPLYVSGGLDHKSSLFESGAIDFLGILDIVAYLETDFGISVENEDVVPENFESVELLADFVNRKQSGA